MQIRLPQNTSDARNYLRKKPEVGPCPTKDTATDHKIGKVNGSMHQMVFAPLSSNRYTVLSASNSSMMLNEQFSFP